ncbi:hypothetical protein [Geomicrobium sp. JCM 19038]|uniref:hypothetical protein n=1 Tax=Geomicrobium sp. JCM 19038 TaxID=1460635 RepID=UPI00045F3CE3|nr:hypothetical protein [Geomicrobium sp. JCM 19038]GAK06969.1 hypothetical protein JCM19038_683 [Geomicrobium sp. JCM 19038]
MNRMTKRILAVALTIFIAQFIIVAGYQALVAGQVNWTYIIISTLIMLLLVGTTAIANRRLEMIQENEEKNTAIPKD